MNATVATRRPRRPSLGRMAAGGLAAGSWLATRLPERLLVPLAEAAGEAWYRATPRRADLARQNLERVAAWAARSGAGSPRLRAAASDPVALEALVRAAYRHAGRYYLEVLRIPGLTPAAVRERLVIDTPETVERAFSGEGPVIFVGLHFGAIELPGLYLSARTGRETVAPMEALPDPQIQAWIRRTRAAVGVRIVGLREARRELLAALRRGESVGLVGDRDITGGGAEVELFGAPARLPIGPALLAIEAGVPLFVVAVRRDGVGRYRGQLREVEVAREGPRRARLTTTLDGIARAFEASIVAAPEQWWAVFFPIWPDLAMREAAAA